MGDLFEAFGNETLNSRNGTVSDLFECQKQYARLVREYKDEIDYVERSLKEIREERRSFYETELPHIKDILNMEEVDEKARRTWINELQDAMEKSFQISERLMNDLVVKQMDEFRRDAERILREGR